MTLEPHAQPYGSAQSVRRITSNTLWLTAADVTSRVMMVCFYLVAARHLGAAKFGTLSFALAFVTLFSVLSDLGLGALTSREIARDRRTARHYIANSLGIKLVVSALVAGIIMLAVRLLGYPNATVKVVYICSVFVLEGALVTFYTSVFQGFERMEFTAIVRIVQATVLIAGTLLMARGSASAENYAVLYVGAGLAALALAASISTVKLVPAAPRFNIGEWIRLLRSALPFGIAMLLSIAYYWNGSTLLARWRGDAAVGIFSAPFRLVMGIVLAGSAFAGAMYPVMSRTFTLACGPLQRMFERAIRFVSIIAFFLGVIGAVMAVPIVAVVYGRGYQASVLTMRVLSAWGAFACLNAFLSNYFFSVDRARVVTMQTAISLTVNVMLNFVLIARAGAAGAAVSIAVAELAGFLFLLLQQRRTEAGVSMWMLRSVWLRVGVSASAAAFAAWIVARWSHEAALAVAVLTYVPVLFLFRGLTTSDVSLLFRSARTDAS